MKLFTYTKLVEPVECVSLACRNQDSHYIGGGTNLIDLMKEGVMQPAHLIDVSQLETQQIQKLPHGGIVIPASARNSDVANHEMIRKDYPLLSRAILAGASPQIRNMATMAGNIMQRTRCSYFYNIDSACNKRTPGSGCDAIEGFNRMNAILGGSKKCIAVHPSDMCVALACLDATIHTQGFGGNRKIKFTEFHTLPGGTPDIETILADNELITSIELPPSRLNKNWCYLKVRDRASYAFALVSVAAALEIEMNTIKTARLALGGVAAKPWRAVEAERMLVGKKPSEETFRSAAEKALKDAKASEHNKFKVELAKRTIVRALKVAAGGLS